MKWLHPKIAVDDKGDLLLNFGRYGQEVELASFSSDGSRLVTVKEVGTATVWDVASLTPIIEISPASPLAGREGIGTWTGGFEVFIESVALNGDGSLALLGLNDGTAGIFSTKSGERLSTLYPPGTSPAEKWSVIRAVAFSPDGSLALVGFAHRALGVWNTSRHALVRFLTGFHSGRLFRVPTVRDTLTSSVAASANNRFAFAGYADMTATLWDLPTGEAVFEACQHAEEILDLWSDGSSVRWATTGGSLWAGPPGRSASERLATGECWQEAWFSSDGEAVIVRRTDGVVRVWSTDGQSQTVAETDARLSKRARTLGMDRVGKLSICVDGARTVCLVTPRGRVRVERDAAIDGFALSPQEDKLATYGWSDRVEMWEVPAGERLAFSQDGNLLAVGILDGRSGEEIPIRIWDTRTGALWIELGGDTRGTDALVFGPHDEWLAATSQGNLVRVWRLDHRVPALSSEVWRHHYPDLAGPPYMAGPAIAALSNGCLLLFRQQALEIWRERELLLTIPVHFAVWSRWRIFEDRSCILQSIDHQVIARYSLETGQELPACRASIARPERVPSLVRLTKLAEAFVPTAGCYLWRTRGGSFVHVGDGPRGWATPLALADDGASIVIPGTTNAALIDLANGQRIVSLAHFEGRLKASRILPERVLLVNSAGALFEDQRTSREEDHS
jgi:WD40 repeat protein